MTVELDQTSFQPKEDLAPYAGRWVALRDGYVVAAELDSVALRNNPAVKPDDVLMPVPTGDSGINIL